MVESSTPQASAKPLELAGSAIWNDLPSVLLARIFSLMGPDRQRLALVSKSWREVAWEVWLGDTAASRPRRPLRSLPSTGPALEASGGAASDAAPARQQRFPPVPPRQMASLAGEGSANQSGVQHHSRMPFAPGLGGGASLGQQGEGEGMPDREQQQSRYNNMLHHRLPNNNQSRQTGHAPQVAAAQAASSDRCAAVEGHTNEHSSGSDDDDVAGPCRDDLQSRWKGASSAGGGPAGRRLAARGRVHDGPNTSYVARTEVGKEEEEEDRGITSPAPEELQGSAPAVAPRAPRPAVASLPPSRPLLCQGAGFHIGQSQQARPNERAAGGGGVQSRQQQQQQINKRARRLPVEEEDEEEVSTAAGGARQGRGKEGF